MSIIKEPFGCKDGKSIFSYTLSNSSGTSVAVITLGATIKNLYVKDRNGIAADIVTGYDSADGYLSASGYSGAVVGRVANRLSNARFEIDGREYHLNANEGKHQLHGGKDGFHFKVWDAIEEDSDEPRLTLSYLSRDGEENYPGNLSVSVTYTLSRKGELAISYHAETDKKTVCALTSHAYFNLGGYASGTVDGNLLWVDSDKIVEIDRELIPIGRFCDVSDTDFDFRKTRRIGDGFSSKDELLRFLGGYDNCFVLSGEGEGVKKVARLDDPESGRYVEVYTDQPCIQIYTANMIDEDDVPFKGGVKQYKHCAVCLETEKMPDSPNHKGFTDITLSPGEVYTHNTVYAFGAE